MADLESGSSHLGAIRLTPEVVIPEKVLNAGSAEGLRVQADDSEKLFTLFHHRVGPDGTDILIHAGEHPLTPEQIHAAFGPSTERPSFARSLLKSVWERVLPQSTPQKST